MKIVFFDLDGTIADTLPMCMLAFQRAVEPYIERKISKEEIACYMGVNEEGMIRRIVGDAWEKAFDDFHRIYAEVHSMCMQPFAGIRSLIRDLKCSGVKLALVTGKGVWTCSYTLKLFGLEHYFDFIETGHPDRNQKSEAITRILKISRLSCKDAVYIGDSVSDVFSCRKVSVECLSVVWGSGVSEEDLLAVNKGNVIYSVQDLGNRLGIYPASEKL